MEQFACQSHAGLTLWRMVSMHTYSVGRTLYRHTLTEYVVLFRNSEESFNKYLSPDPDHVRGNPSHGYTPYFL